MQLLVYLKKKNIIIIKLQIIRKKNVKTCVSPFTKQNAKF